MPRIRIKEKIWETQDTCSFYFENLEGNTLFFKPGQFITVHFLLNGQEFRRSYSLSTVPVRDKRPGIAVKRVKGGIISNYMLDNLEVGDTLEYDFPAGTFYPELGAQNKTCYFLIGAGSGITPLYSMLQTILHKESLAQIVLLYANRNEQSIIFKDKLDQLDFLHSDRLKIIHILSSPSAEWPGFKARLHDDLLKNLILELNQLEAQDTRFFLCGPDPFMQMAKETILELGFVSSAIKMEKFVPLASPQKKVDTEPSPGMSSKTAKIVYGSKEYMIEINGDQTILEAALENGIKLPYSCQNGVCTACMGTCLEGKVDVSDADALTESEKNKGYILTCVGRPISDHVVIQVE
jgi:ring-1,2-phenylacetyl-CoA epoxidase subunit PaaE